MNGDEDLELKVVLLHKLFKIRNRLEVVGIQILRIQSEIGLNVIVKFNHFKLYAFFFKLRFDEVDDVRMGHWRHTDVDDFISSGSAG